MSLPMNSNVAKCDLIYYKKKMYNDSHNRFETGTVQVGALFCLF